MSEFETARIDRLLMCKIKHAQIIDSIEFQYK